MRELATLALGANSLLFLGSITLGAFDIALLCLLAGILAGLILWSRA